jgi:hypothetical protein
MIKRFLAPTIGAMCLGLALSACSISGIGASPSPSETISAAKASIAAQSASQSSSALPSTSVGTRTEVIWADYSLGLKSDIENATVSKDCRGIQTFFGLTTATEDSMKAAKGHGNANLVSYLNESLKLAGCS